MQTIHIRILVRLSFPCVVLLPQSFTRLSIDIHDSFCFRILIEVLNIHQWIQKRDETYVSITILLNNLLFNLPGWQPWLVSWELQDNCVVVLFHCHPIPLSCIQHRRLISFLIKVKIICLFNWFHYSVSESEINQISVLIEFRCQIRFIMVQSFRSAFISSFNPRFNLSICLSFNFRRFSLHLDGWQLNFHLSTNLWHANEIFSIMITS